MTPLKVDIGRCHYQAAIGVGGVGSGMFFALDGNHTLGREESRCGRFLDKRDYCKLHIVSYYIRALLGRDFATILVSKVGADAVGESLLAEMQADGLDVRYVERAEGQQTLFSLCFVYPDGAGGNLTTNDSACAHVDADYVAKARADFVRFAGRGIALALPEVPLAARMKLLELGAEYGFFRVASFTAAEMIQAAQGNGLCSVDLLAINLEEAAAAMGMFAEDKEPEMIVEAVAQAMCFTQPRLQLSITAGRRGSWSWDGQSLVHVPAFPAKVVSTAGAGDAHIAGIIVGLTAGLSLAQAQELGTLTAALSVTSPHTINKEIDRKSLRAFASTIQAPISDAVWRLLEN